MNEKKIYEIIESLKSTSKTNEKLKILIDNKQNLQLKEFLEFALLPKYVYSVKKYILPELEEIMQESIENVKIVLQNLHNRLYTGNAAQDYINITIGNLGFYSRELFKMCIERDLKCGVNNKLLSKVWNEFDNETKLCKANSYSEKNLKNISFPAYSELKADGARCLIHCDISEYGIDIYAVSANGKPIVQFPEKIKTSIKLLANDKFIVPSHPQGFILDGELLFRETDGTFADRKKSNGIVNKLLKGTASQEEIYGICVKLWDFIDKQDYNNGKGTTPYFNRKNTLKHSIETMNNHHIIEIESKIVNNQDEVFAHFTEMLERGEEGTILKNEKFMWEPKRSKHCVKFKIEFDTTLKIVDIKEGKKGSKYENQLGALICETDCGTLQVSVGSGFTDEERLEYWRDAAGIIGSYVDVRANNLITNKSDNTFSLFLPRFIKFRIDKDETDTISAIKLLSNGIDI